MKQLNCEGKNKSDIINHIMARVTNVHRTDSTIGITKKIAKANAYDGQAHLHDFYRNCFNLIDKGDKLWYQVADSHANHKWKSKMLFCIMRHFMINVWVLMATHNYKLWAMFRTSLACDLVEIDI